MQISPNAKHSAAPKRLTVYRVLTRLDQLTGASLRLASFLVLPLSLLLFLQWPLREIVQAYSREANDFAQILFALYISFAITSATRQSGHLAADAFARRFSLLKRRRFERIAALMVLVPWAGFVLWAGWPGVTQSVLALESFPETNNPGYFIVRLSVAILTLLVLLQGLIDIFHRLKDDKP